MCQKSLYETLTVLAVAGFKVQTINRFVCLLIGSLNPGGVYAAANGVVADNPIQCFFVFFVQLIIKYWKKKR